MEDKIWLFLDDDPNRAALLFQRLRPEDRNRTIWTKTTAEAVEVLDNYRAELERAYISYDLAGDALQHTASEECGMEVVRFLEKQDAVDYINCKFVIHSWNLDAAVKMEQRLVKSGYSVSRKPFGM